MNQSRTITIAITGTAVSLAAGIFVLDLLTPLGLPVWLLYLFPILLLWYAPARAVPFLFAGLCSLLTGLGFYFSTSGIPSSIALVNRLIGIVLFWVVAIGVSTRSDTAAEALLVLGLSRRTVANLLSVSLIMILFGVMTYRVTVASQESVQLVARTHEVLTELSLTLSALKDAETGQLSFLLTGEDRYVDPYERAVVDVSRHVDRLSNLTQDNPLQQGRLRDFSRVVEEKLAELRDTIPIRRSQGSDAALRMVKTGHGKTVMDDLNRRVAEMEADEQDLLVQREQQATILSHAQTALVVLGGIALAGLMAVTVLLLRREHVKQQEMAAAMRLTLATLDATMDGTFVFDPRTLRFSHVNVGAVRQVGYSEEELLGMTPLDIMPEFDEPRFWEMLMPLVSGAQPIHTFTTIHRRKDGVDIPVEINLQCVEAGTAQARLIAVARDVTERKRADVRIQEQGRRFRSIFESVPVSIWEEDWADVIAAVASLRSQGVTDFERYFADHQELVTKLLRMIKVVDVNSQTCAIFDATTKDQLLTSLETVFSTEDTLPGFVSELVALAEGRQIFRTEMALRTVRGRLIHVLLTMTFPNSLYPTERVLVCLMDITARKRSEEAQERLAAIVEGTDDAIISKTLDGIITSWNQAAERLYGYKAEEVMGKSVKMLIPQDRWGEEMEIVDRVRQSEQVRHFETVRQTKDGRLVDISLTVSPLTDEHGTLIGISGIARDITARKWADEELKRQARLLEATNKELEAFSYSVSHDLRAPLRSLEGLSLALLEDCSERLDETGKDYLKRIRGEIERMGQLIEDLLQLALATRMELRRESVDLSALAASRAEEVRKQWSGRQVELIVESELKAEGDCRLLGIVLDNLLGNAWKFTSGRERATVEVGAERLDRKTVYFVRDNGAGFDMTYAGKLFGVFQRLHAATEYPGTGIGLALVQRIVHRHGGRVWAEGAVDKGTTVYFTLP